jgi:SAM-dependent methyltransferase
MPRASNEILDFAGVDETELATVHAGISDYYTSKIRKFGATPFGVDWTCQPTQELRFVQLLKVCDFASPFSLNDLGCGYGALVTYLDQYHPACSVDYLGIDLSPAMLRQARRLWRNRANVSFAQGSVSSRLADYSVASGIFNVQQDQPREVWERFVAATLGRLHAASRRGFAVNFVSSDLVLRKGLYSVEPAQWSRYCAGEFGAAIEVIDGYGLREFTLIVRRAI